MRRIHIAEDEVEIAELLALFFEKRGYQVSISKTADEAMKAIETEVPDFAILDLYLEGHKSGLEILRFIKEKYPAIKTIIASGVLDNPLQDDLEGFKPDIYLKKPYSLDELSDSINSLC
ncbi:MAG: response regulator transcription factor [bacterium]